MLVELDNPSAFSLSDERNEDDALLDVEGEVL